MATTSSTTSTTSTSTGLGSLNFGSGADLDLDKYYSKIEEAENSTLKTYDNRKAGVQTKVSAYATIKNSIDALKSQAQLLTSDNFQKSAKATTSAVAYIPKATDNSISGTYDIKVNQLATSQANASKQVADKTSTLGSGTITLKQGSGAEVSVAVNNASLEGVRNAINSAKDSSGKKLNISAAVISNSDGTSYLTVSSTVTGAANAFTIGSSGDSGLTDVVSNMSVKRNAANAKFSVNGVDLEASTNDVKDAVPGLELTLSSVSTAAETTTVDNNTDDWAAGVSNFVSSYNSFLSTMSSLTKYDTSISSLSMEDRLKKYDDAEKSNSTSKDTGALAADSGALSIRSQIKELMSNDNLAALKEFGITAIDMNKVNSSNPAGTLEIDATKLQKAMTTNPAGFKKVLAGEKGQGGIMSQVTAKVDALENSKTGVLTKNSEALTKKIDRIDEQRERAAKLVDFQLKAYKKSFTQLVKFKTSMDAQIDSLKLQFEALRKS